MHDDIQGNLYITDVVISGKNEGHLRPAPKETDLLIVSDNPAAVNLTAAEIMGVRL